MIKCPNCSEITITRTVSGDLVCNTCGTEWKGDVMNKYEHKCIRCNSNSVVADYYDFDAVTLRCNDCGLVWDESIITVTVPPIEHKSKPPTFDTNEHDAVNHPQHYANGMTVEVECIMFTRWLDFDLGNAFKYVWRAGNKDDALQDIEKAIWYLEDAEAYDMSCGEIKLLNFLPKSSLPEWKYTALRSILLGNIDDALCSLYEQLGKTAHNNRKR